MIIVFCCLFVICFCVWFQSSMIMENEVAMSFWTIIILTIVFDIAFVLCFNYIIDFGNKVGWF